jgi:ParB-like chromosome segregation protein Spo0J
MSKTSWAKRGQTLAAQLAKLDEADRVDALNTIRRALHSVSPFQDEPVDCVEWVRADIVCANSYNPNSVAPPEMKLLEHSIASDGYTQPIVTHDTGLTREVVDGFHRNRVGKESESVRARVHGYLPVVTIRADREAIDDRMASTIRHNRARGVHGVDKMTDIVSELAKKGWDDIKIGKELGMDPDEVLRFRQISGLAELFHDQEFSEAWELKEMPDENSQT